MIPESDNSSFCGDSLPVSDPRDLRATVILLCYNQESKIRAAMESVLRQRCPYRFEILVADDDSSDRTRVICEEYAARYPGIVRLLPPHPNKGIVDNYFDAVLNARGEYVADCAGDDRWEDPDRLRRSIEALDADASLSVVFTDTVLVRENVDGSETALRIMGDEVLPERVAGKDILLRVLNHTTALPYVLSSALFRRSPVVDALSATPDILRCHAAGVEDVPLIAFLATKGDALHLPVVGYRYYIGGESASNNLSAQKDYRFVAGITSMVRRLGKHYGLKPSQQHDHFREKFNYMAAQVRRSGDRTLMTDFNARLREWPFSLPLRGRIHLLLSRLGYRR